MMKKHKPLIYKIVKSPYWPAFLSCFVAPGMGQISNRELNKGFLLLFASLGPIFWFTRVMTEQLSRILPGTPDQWKQNQAALKDAIRVLYEHNPGLFVSFHLLILTVWSFGVIDAYLTAKKRHRERARAINENPHR